MINKRDNIVNKLDNYLYKKTMIDRNFVENF